ncbi:Hydroxyethylthiazole kinase [bioreactor metagenome]|uniref:hydroxyethylthiazole kinase n=1 Tax=bioreactor metagenome TaxID=1076179 RepID=A0A645JEY9_9ZZZZ
MMSKITGSGCMLTSVIGAYCGANPDNILDSTAAALCAMGLCGQIAYEKTEQTKGGTASFRTYLIDAMSKMDWPTLKGGMKIETR